MIFPREFDLNMKNGGTESKMFRGNKGGLRYIKKLKLFAKSKIMSAHFVHHDGV